MKFPIFASLLLVTSSFSSLASAEAPLMPRPVLWTEATLQTLQETRLVGDIEPKTKTDLGFQVLGQLIQKNVETGEVVSDGQLLAGIDPAPFLLALRAAQSGLSDARARLSAAIADEARQQSLFASNAIPETALEVAVQQLKTAQANETRAQAELDKAQEQFGYTRIFAEHDGIVIGVYPEVGEVVAPGQVVLTIARIDTREAVVELPSDFASEVAVGDRATISLELNPQAQIVGEIREIEPTIDSLSRTVRARITLMDAPKSFRLGSTVFVNFGTNNTPAIFLPESAIVMQAGSANVWVINDQGTAAHLTQVSIATAKGGFVKITSGVEPGDRIVTMGVNSLTPDTAFRLGEEQIN